MPLSSVRRRVFVSWTLAGIAALAICWELYRRDVRQVEQTTLEREVTRSNFFGTVLDADYRSTAADLRVLAESDDLADALNSDPSSPSFGTISKQTAFGRFSRDMLHRLEQQPEYDEIRYADAAGRERARADRQVGIASEADLGDKRDTSYFNATMRLQRGQIYLSPLHLRRQNGQIERPLTPFARLATPVIGPHGERWGVIAINYLGSALLQRFQSVSAAARKHIRLLNADGYWLKSSDSAEEWGQDLPERQGMTLARTDPPLWASVSTRSEGQLPYRGGWFTWHRIEPYSALGQPPQPGSFMIAASELPADEWLVLNEGRGQPYLIVALTLLVVIATGAVVHDARVRERKRTEDALRLAHDNAQESARLKAQFLANMSHEIRTPLNGVVGMTGLLLDTPLSPEQRNYASTVRASADALLALINDILDFSKIEAGQLEFEHLPFDLRDPVENCLSLAAEKAHGKNLELAYLIEENVPTALVGDSNRLHQVLLNLVGNAVKFTAVGEVVLRVRKVGDEEGKVRLRFEVRDTGIGVSPETAQRLFQPFVQGDSSTSRKFGGTGLGLAICRQLVTLMAGEIGVESPPTGGAIFWFTAALPVGTSAPRVVPRKADLAGLRALIVDDNETNREILSRQLASWRMETKTAKDGREATAAIKQAAAAGIPFQFAIFDMEMPGLSGLATATVLQADPALAGLRKIILTSVGNPLSRPVLETAGVSSCLVKPARQSALHDALVEAFVGSGHPAAQGEPRPGLEGAAAIAPDRSLRVLVVEDNLVNQHVARLMLEKFGYRPDIVGGGHAALEAIQQKRYDVILMDCQMPDLDGFETTRMIRVWEAERRVAGDTTEPIAVVAMTANAMSGDREACLAAGMQDYVTKPVRAHELAAALARTQLQNR